MELKITRKRFGILKVLNVVFLYFPAEVHNFLTLNRGKKNFPLRVTLDENDSNKLMEALVDICQPENQKDRLILVDIHQFEDKGDKSAIKRWLKEINQFMERLEGYKNETIGMVNPAYGR